MYRSHSLCFSTVNAMPRILELTQVKVAFYLTYYPRSVAQTKTGTRFYANHFLTENLCIFDNLHSCSGNALYRVVREVANLARRKSTQAVQAWDLHQRTKCHSLGAFAKFRKATISCVMGLSVRPHGTTLLPVDGFRRKLTFEFFFSKIYRENLSFIKI